MTTSVYHPDATEQQQYPQHLEASLAAPPAIDVNDIQAQRSQHTSLMARQYTQEELLGLRASPLVCKPATLPPVEEWMG